MAINRDAVNWTNVGRAIEGARLSYGWGKEEAARRAGVSSITWKRAEEGLRVQDAKLAAMCRALEIQLNLPGLEQNEVVVLGGEVAVQSVIVDEGSNPALKHVVGPDRQGGDHQDDNVHTYVESPGESVEPAVDEPEVLQAIREMRDAVNTLSERVDRLEHGS